MRTLLKSTPTGTSPTEMLRACVIVSYIPESYLVLKVFTKLTGS
jgi:hypothetical protein